MSASEAHPVLFVRVVNKNPNMKHVANVCEVCFRSQVWHSCGTSKLVAPQSLLPFEAPCEVVLQSLSSRGTHNLRRLSPKASLAEAPTTLKSRSSLLLGLARGLRRDLAAQPPRTVLLGSGVSTVIETLAKLLEVYQQI